MNTSVNNGVGFYGKLPILGDFVSRRLPMEFITPWDSWLQSAIAASREEIGSEWLSRYLTSPIWRFLLSPGVCGDKAVAGIIMPSVDKVGRYYPLTVALVFEQSPTLPFLFTEANVWFEQLEDVALTGLEGNIDITSFDQLVQSIPIISLPLHGCAEQQSDVEKKSFYTRMEFGHTANAFIGLNAQLLASFIPGYSLWSNAGAEHVQAALLAYEGLPPIGSFSTFLKGTVNNTGHSVDPEDAIFMTTEPITIAPEQPSLSDILGTDATLIERHWQSWAVTDTGKRRQHNEDALLNRPEAGLWVVADGMGGHTAGDVASQLIVDTLQSLPPAQSLENYVKAVESSLQQVNTALRQLRVNKYNNHLVGSTVVVLVCEEHRCAFLWVGDSRLYRFRDNQLQQLTQDHCVADDYDPPEGAVKKNNNITRAVGAYEELELDIEITEMREGDIFLLCSDGLDKEISFKDIERVMQTYEPQDIANTLVNETLVRGARDNVTVVVVAIESNL